jgi:hypothetical protein
MKERVRNWFLGWVFVSFFFCVEVDGKKQKRGGRVKMRAKIGLMWLIRVIMAYK